MPLRKRSFFSIWSEDKEKLDKHKKLESVFSVDFIEAGMSSECLAALKAAIASNAPIAQNDQEQTLQIGDKTFDLALADVFKGHDLKTIYFYYTHKDESITEYIKQCEESHVGVVPFQDRNDFMEMLTATEGSAASATTATKAKDDSDDILIKQIKMNEKELIDHNKALRGSKLIDFSQIKRECEYKIIKPILSSKKSSKPTTASVGLSTTLKNKEPIILMSPSASALLNMSNIKEFLTNGKFNNTPGVISGSNDIVKIKLRSNKFNKSINFIVTNNIEKFNVKPEYWDRVVSIFTTGQEWQFKNYKYKEPNVLFQKYKGFYVGWEGERVPENVNKWNVEIIKLDRNGRFKDSQLSQHLWESLERWMGSMGYK